MISVASDYLIAHQGSVTGSIGVIAQSFEFTELAEKVGVHFHNFKSSPLKGGPIPTEKLSPEMAGSMDAIIKDLYDSFYAMVLQRRNINDDQLKKIADGRAFTGRQALKLGLIDAIGDEDLAVKWLKAIKKVDKNLEVIDYQIDEPAPTFSPFFDSRAFEKFFTNLLKSTFSRQNLDFLS
jgi:protease-4